METLETAQHPQCLGFLIGGEEYAIGILQVREIIQFVGVTRVPQAPAWVRGVINLRGSVVPVVDLAVRFGESALAPSRSTCVVIAEARYESEAVVVGVLADAVTEVLDLPVGDVLPPPAFGARGSREYLRGIGRIGERLVLLLDADRLLTAEQAAAAVAVAEGGPSGDEPQEPKESAVAAEASAAA